MTLILESIKALEPGNADMNEGEIQRNLGSLSAKMENMESRLSDMKRDMDIRFERQDDRLDEVIKTLNKLSGGWQFIMMVGTVVGIVTALVTAWKMGFVK
tara:strand:+ start:4822 stop:5121 length:300 start_codon:yes stop_codon:yes gene_type:complete